MQRKVEFYKIDFTLLPLASIDKTKNDLNNLFIKILNDSKFKTDTYEIKYYDHSGSSVVIELLEVESTFMFGIIGKLENLQNGPLKRLREKESNEVLEAEISDLGFYLEHFTYFYVCKKTLYCSVLGNNPAPKFKSHFQNFLLGQVNMTHIDKISLNVVLDQHIDRKINNVKNLATLDVTFNDTSNLGKQLLELKNTFDVSQDSLNKARVTINLKLSPMKENTKSILKRLSKSTNEFEKLAITGFDEKENQVAMELIEKILLKTVEIDIDDNQLISSQDLEEIKRALKDSLMFI